MQSGIEEQRALYQKRIPIFPRSIQGNFRRFKWAVLILAYVIFFGLPWLPWARPDAPGQAVMFDLVGRRFFIFDLVVYPQDMFWLALLLFIAATFLFFVTSLVGRAFCGYFCFQTLWTDLYIWVEKLIQGERPARIRLYKQPWNLEKIYKLGATHALWIAIAFWTGMTFILYFGYAPNLIRQFFTGEGAYAAYLTVLVLTISTYVAAGMAREQICTYMCPYARFQGVMYDPETLSVWYDTKRGDSLKGRATLKGDLKQLETRHSQGYGDCIDCGLCVQVCPAGIDIRNGMQYQCISCGLCVDACNSIMKSVGFPTGLIRYDSETNIQSGKHGKVKLDFIRIKTVGYGVALAIMIGLLGYNIFNRTDYEESVQQVRQPLFVVLSDGRIRNRYQIHITNKTDHNETYRVMVKGIPSDALDLGNLPQVRIHSGQSLMVQANVMLPPEVAEKTHEFDFVITPLGSPELARTKQARFYAR